MFHMVLRHVANCRVGVLEGSTGNGLTGAGVASHEPRQQHNRLIPNLGTWIGRQNIDEIPHYVWNAKRLRSASLTRESMQRDFAHRGYRIAQSKAKHVPRGIAGIVVQKK
jgi:hypothetical protein